MALVVLDASVVIAFLDPDDALHDAAVEALTEHQREELVIPLSVYAEILVAPYRRGAEAVAEVEAFLADFAVRIEAVTPRSGGRWRIFGASLEASGSRTSCSQPRKRWRPTGCSPVTNRGPGSAAASRSSRAADGSAGILRGTP